MPELIKGLCEIYKVLVEVMLKELKAFYNNLIFHDGYVITDIDEEIINIFKPYG